MPIFCFPCSSASAVLHFDEKDTTPQSPNEVKVVTGDNDLGKPTVGDYAGETAREFINILAAVAQEIPVPGVSSAVKLAANLIKACDDGHATLERAEELKIRIKTLVTVLVNELKGKKAEEIQQKLLEDINSLEGDLQYIQTKLDEISSQHAFLVVFYRSFNDGKVRKCMERVNSSLERFDLAHGIDHTNMLDQLEKQIRTFHARQQQSLDQIQTSVDSVNAKMDNLNASMNDVKAILSERHPSHSRSRAAVPANTGIFCGRDALVTDLARILTTVSEGKQRPRACLLGPGGMGKTSTALAVMAHPDMAKHFPDDRRVWVPCVKATTISLFLDTLYSSLAITRNTGDTHSDIVSELESSDPLILLLDNFETPWNVEEGRSEVERILRDIHRIPHVALFITVRSASPPCDDISWHSVDLRAVDLDAARQIYSNIYIKGSTDPDLPELLEAVGNMPLAITLMAKVAKVTGLSAEQLVKKYNVLGTALLGQGSDAEHSMNISIGLSVDSPSMKRHPGASDLLAILAILPVGTTYDMLENWYACDLPNVLGALEVLRETSLVEHQGSTFFVLPVIQRYVLDPSRFPDKVSNSMIQSACKFLAARKSSPGDDSYKDHRAALSIEEGNLQAILLHTTTPTPASIDALLVLAQHQELTRPRTNVIQHALNLVRGMENNLGLLGSVLLCYGCICVQLNSYDDAQEHYKRARELFLAISDIKRAAECLLKLFYVYFLMAGVAYEKKKALIADAQAEFESINDRHGVALCQFRLGCLQWQYGRSSGSYSEAIDLLHQARTTFTEFKDPVISAQCCYRLSQAYYRQKQYELAQTWALSTVQEYDHIGRYQIGATDILACTHILKGDYDAALQLLLPALEQSKSYGDVMGSALTLEQIGRTWAKMGKREDAIEAFEECLRMYSTSKAAPEYEIRCRFFLRKMEDPLSSPSPQEVKAFPRLYPEDIEDLL